MVKDIGELDCPFRTQAGSYYNLLPWMTCSKMPSSDSSENEMCDIDAGRECRFASKVPATLKATIGTMPRRNKGTL